MHVCLKTPSLGAGTQLGEGKSSFKSCLLIDRYSLTSLVLLYLCGVGTEILLHSVPELEQKIYKSR